MPDERKVPLDGTDRRILEELQENARLSFRELGRRISMSPPAVAERVRRLEDVGVLRGYRAVVDLERVGLPILAFVRVRYPSGDYRPFRKAIENREEVLECHHITGEDCFVVKLAAASMRDLEEATGHLARLGATTTSIVFSTLLAGRNVKPPAADRS